MILEILSNSRTQGESWIFHKFLYLNFSQIWKEDQFDFNIFPPIIFNKKNREDNMTSSKERNIGEQNLKSNYYFICILFELEKYAFLKIAFLGQKNVHLVLNIRFGR